MLHDPRSRASDLLEVLAHEPSMTARLLRLANSSFFGLPGHVETVPHAVEVLGLEQVRELALAAFSARQSGRVETSAELVELWQRSVRCALIARALAARLRLNSPEGLFVAGLLHAVGRLLPGAAGASPEQGGASPATGSAEAACERYYADLGAELLEAWNLPARLVLAVRLHGAPAEAPGCPIEAVVLHVASVLARATSPSAAGVALAAMEHAARVRLGLDADLAEGLVREAEQTLERLGTAITNTAAARGRGRGPARRLAALRRPSPRTRGAPRADGQELTPLLKS